MYRYVLDSSALLAVINEERGDDKVREILPFSVMSSVNIAECTTILSEVDFQENEIKSLLKELVAEIVPFEEAHAFEAGMLRKTTKIKGLSLGDRSCLALGKIMKLPVVTADRKWKEVDCGIVVNCIR